MAANHPVVDANAVSKRIVEIITKETATASFAPSRGYKGSNLTTFSADDGVHEKIVATVTEKLVKKYPGDSLYHYNGFTGDGPSLKAAMDFCVRMKRKLLLISHFNELCPVDSVEDDKSREAIMEVLRLVARLETRACSIAVFALVDPNLPLNGAVSSHEFIKLDNGPE